MKRNNRSKQFIIEGIHIYDNINDFHSITPFVILRGERFVLTLIDMLERLQYKTNWEKIIKQTIRWHQ